MSPLSSMQPQDRPQQANNSPPRNSVCNVFFHPPEQRLPSVPLGAQAARVRASCCAAARDVGTTAHNSCWPSARGNMLPHCSPRPRRWGLLRSWPSPGPKSPRAAHSPPLPWTRTSPCLGRHASQGPTVHTSLWEGWWCQRQRALRQAAQACARQQLVRGLAPCYSDRGKEPRTATGMVSTVKEVAGLPVSPRPTLSHSECVPAVLIL